MLRTAKVRLQNKKRKAMPKKPQPPAVWLDPPYPHETVIAFFWDWIRADMNPAFTPDSLPWLDQDPQFWEMVYYVHDLFRWAEHRAENPVMQIRSGDMTMDKL